MDEAGVKPAMLTLRSAEFVTMVTGAPLRSPATRASALECPPAHCEYWLAMRVASVGAGAEAAMALAANASEAASEAASVERRMVMVEVSLELAPLCVDAPRCISRPGPKVD